jgi:hypothetical protein
LPPLPPHPFSSRRPALTQGLLTLIIIVTFIIIAIIIVIITAIIIITHGLLQVTNTLLSVCDVFVPWRQSSLPYPQRFARSFQRTRQCAAVFVAETDVVTGHG